MIICILGDNLTSLSLAKNLVNKKLNVHLIYDKKNKSVSNSSRTIGISQDNIDFFNKKIIKINSKLLWNINNIEIFSERTTNDKIFNFENKDKNLFSIIKNDNLYNLLNNDLAKNKYFHKKLLIKNLLAKKFWEEYDLVINCDSRNQVSKKFFSKSLNKDYNNNAYTTIIKHNVFYKNNSAVQVFTQKGPIAFLPLSNFQTSVVFSMNSSKDKVDNEKIINLIKKHNFKYSINEIGKIGKIELKFSNLRNYYHKNILAFGDLIHKIHPLAGQGFNMTIRDIKALSEIIDNKIDIGLPVDSSVASEFEKKNKHKNFIFSNGIDFIYEFFNLETKFKSPEMIKFLKFLGNNSLFKKNIINYANRGF
jgi:2-octaprenyl-6-methoxyphenol hydroxylase